MEFKAFPKIPRLSREIVITEKIDGTNAQITIAEDALPITLESGRVVPFLCGSRNRFVFPENDNQGFAKWAYAHVEELLQLGPGTHYGEWWGHGIQRGYGLKEKRFSLFNTGRWLCSHHPIDNAGARTVAPFCCYVVPTVLISDSFEDVETALEYLKDYGSIAAPGYMNPEGIVAYHTASKSYFKKTFEKDEGKERA